MPLTMLRVMAVATAAGAPGLVTRYKPLGG